MTPEAADIIVEALAIAATRKEMQARTANGASPATTPQGEMAQKMRRLRIDMIRARELAQSVQPDNVSALTLIERRLIGWFEVNKYQVANNGEEWHAWIGGKMIPVSEIARGIMATLGKSP